MELDRLSIPISASNDRQNSGNENSFPSIFVSFDRVLVDTVSLKINARENGVSYICR